MSRPPARHEKPLPSPARFDLHNEPRYDDARYLPPAYGPAVYTEAPYHDDVRYGEARYGEARYGGGSFDVGSYDVGSYDDARYEDSRYDEPRYGSFDDGSYQQDLYGDDDLYGDGPYREAAYDDRGYAQGVAERRRPPGGRGAHRRARPPRMRRRPVRIAAVMAGSTLLVAGAAPVAAHWWHRPATHPTAPDQDSPSSTPGAALGAQNSRETAASHNALDQWVQIPVGKHAAAQVRAAKRAARHAAAQPSHSPRPQPKATSSSAYENPLRAVSDLVLERVDQGVDFGGAGPVYALGDGVITNATDQSSGWPGGGWITYQLTDGPDAGLVVYLAEDVTPTVQVGQKVTSSTVIANMFNGGDGIETGWATADSSTAESQTAAAGGISGGGPFPTMVGLSFDAVLESVGVPAAPNANEPGSGLLPAGYPPVAS